MRTTIRTRVFASLLVTFCLLIVPLSAYAKKGDEHFKKGMQYEAAQQWEKAAQEFTLALAANPANPEFQLHFRRASFNASQAFMQQGRALAEQRDYVGAYNAFRQAYGYDAVNQLSVSEMERMLRLQAVKDGTAVPNTAREGDDGGGTPTNAAGMQEPPVSQAHSEQVRQVSYSGDLKAFIRTLADQLNLNVVFDKQSFGQPRQIDINLKDVTTAQTMDYIFLQESLFFQKLSRRTILIADQNRRAQYQQLVLRTFFLSNTDPQKASELIRQAIPPSVGRPQTIVVPDKDTNTLTVRDTAENVRLIGDLLTSIDKDRPEVVMDVNIYEVSRSDLLQLGNQIGTATTNLGGSTGLSILSRSAVTSAAQAGVNVASIIGGVPTALGAALVIPPSVLTAFQSKDNTRLIASTQVHAFNNEESTARIGQRVPVQTAQAYPFGTNTGGTQTSGGFPSGGFPVINYEPTGLTLKFTPLVYPNFDVQVKMSIESKDVLGAQTITPTFTERTITGTARVQNNRTMLLASVSTDIQSNGRQGLPVLGLMPVLGRLFSSPTKSNRTIDIVIAVTPRVLRAPAVTPRDLEMRPSGTLSNPTLGSLEAMVRDADREDQIIAMRRLPRNTNLQLPDAEPGLFAALKNVAMPTTESAQSTATGSGPVSASAAWSASVALRDQPNLVAANRAAPVPVASAPSSDQRPQAVEESGFVPAPRSLINSRSAAEVAAVNTGAAGTTNAVLTSAPQPIDVSLETARMSRIAQLKLATTDEPLKVGEKRRIAIELKSDVPLGLALLALKFDPRIIAVRGVSAGSLLMTDRNTAPSLSQSIDPTGVCLISISALNGAQPLQGSGVLLFIDIEGLAAGDGGLVFAKDSMHLVAVDARDVVLSLTTGQTVVKQ